MNRTLIEWCRNPDGSPGFTWNPLTGCLNHTPEGLCLGGMFPCYAFRLANGRLRTRYLANPRIAIPEGGLDRAELERGLVSDPFYPRFWEDRVAKMGLYTGVGKGIFTCDMSDLFGIGIPERWTTVILEAIAINRRNRFYLLTKQPQNLIKFSPFPDNCWVGVTATDGVMAHKAIQCLKNVQANVRFISFEPLLASVNNVQLDVLDWVIIGAQTKPTLYSKDSWIQEIESACDKASIPVFEKNNLYPAGFRHLLRQEIPV